MNYKIIGIPEEISNRVRQNMRSPQYRHPASVGIATGYGPCRSCLETFHEGKEERILFTYNAFEGVSDLPNPGPIFIHKSSCEKFDSSEFPEKLKDLPILFEGYGNNSDLIFRESMNPQNVETKINEILNENKVKYINLRNAEAGCFIARIERN